MQSTQTKNDGALVITIHEPRLDTVNSAAFKNLMIDAVNRGETSLVIDLGEVDFMDSSGLSSLLSTLKSLQGKGEIVLAGLSEKVKKLFAVTKMERIFQIYPNLEQALDARR